jgi:hypothetical protein
MPALGTLLRRANPKALGLRENGADTIAKSRLPLSGNHVRLLRVVRHFRNEVDELAALPPSIGLTRCDGNRDWLYFCWF